MSRMDSPDKGGGSKPQSGNPKTRAVGGTRPAQTGSTGGVPKRPSKRSA